MKYKKNIYLVLVLGTVTMISIPYSVNSQNMTLEPTPNPSKLYDELTPRQFDDIDRMCNYITKKFFTNRLSYYIEKKIRDNQYILGPNAGDAIVLDNVLPSSQNNIKIGQEPFDLQPNIQIWGGLWYGVTQEEVQDPYFTDFAMAVERRNNSDTSYANLSIISGTLDQPEIQVDTVGTSIVITRTSNVSTKADLSSGNVLATAKFTNNYGTASNNGTTFGGTTSNWYTSDASENSFNDSINLDLKIPLISLFEVETKNNNKTLYSGQSFSEEPENFYNIINLPIHSTSTQASWKTKPNMNVIGPQTATLQVNNTSGGYLQTKELKINFNIKNSLEIQPKPTDIPLGTKLSDIDPDVFIDSVKLGDTELSKNEYTVKIKNSPDTTRIGSPEFSLEVIPEYDTSLAQNIKVGSNIVWGSTLVVKNNSLNAVDTSVSLLHKEGIPHLNANNGSGLSALTGLTSRPSFNVYRNNTTNRVLNFSYGTVNQRPRELAQNWNGIFESSSLQYGDVVVGYVTKFNGGANWKGNNTFISRNNTLITETVGYDNAYYELTPSGYRLMRINQLVLNNNQKVKLNTSKEEMNKNISNFISLPEQIENPNDFRMEFESVDTASSGNKKSTINVYETLESGGEFKTTYEVAYSINPEVTEFYYDVDGKQIEQSQITEFELGKEFTPNPEKYIENKGELYIYRGWVDTLPGTENIVPQEGVPEATKVEKSYYYIYDKADKFINVTLPTEVVFGTFENNNKISSKAYEIKNNSDEIPIEVSLEQFDKVKSDIKLLSSNTPDPTQEEASAKLNLYVDKESVIPGLTEDTPRQTITKIDTNTSRAISLEGTYFGNMSEKNILDYKMHLRFKATKDNKN